MTEEEKQKLFLFLRRCEKEGKSFLETFELLKLTGDVSLTEAIDILAEYKRSKSEGQEIKHE